MGVIKKDNGNWEVNGQEFDRVILALGFGIPEKPHLKHHCVVAAGMRIDGIVVLFEGVVANDLGELLCEAIDMKDIYYTRVCYYPAKAIDLVNDMRKVEGLCFYAKEREKTTNREFYITPPSAWKFFKNRNLTCTLAPVLPAMEINFLQFVEMFKARNKEGQILIPKNWSDLTRLLSRPLRESYNNSVLRATVYATITLDRLGPELRNDYTGAKQLYPNLTRRHRANRW